MVRPDGAASPTTLVAFAGRQRKALSQESKCHTDAVSASARKWIHVICPLPGGTELLMAGLSILVEPLYPISTLSQPIQPLFLIAFFHLPLSLSLCIPASVLVLERPSAFNKVSIRSYMSLTLIFSCQCVCLCVCMNKQWKVTWCVLQ